MIYVQKINEDKSIGSWVVSKDAAQSVGFEIELQDNEIEEANGVWYLKGSAPIDIIADNDDIIDLPTDVWVTVENGNVIYRALCSGFANGSTSLYVKNTAGVETCLASTFCSHGHNGGCIVPVKKGWQIKSSGSVSLKFYK